MPAEILDVHAGAKGDLGAAIRKDIVEGLLRPAGQKQMPTMLLYDERGLRLYDDITTEVPEYYLFGAEEEILKHNAQDIVAAMHRGAGGVVMDEVVLELGAGSLRKTSHILNGLGQSVGTPRGRPPITYYALDLEEPELERCLNEIAVSEVGKNLEGKVVTKGMWGTYEDGLKFVQSGGLQNSNAAERFSRANMPSNIDARDASPSSISTDSSTDRSSDSSSSLSPSTTPDDTPPPLHLLFLGCSLGNFSRSGQADFLRSLPLRPGSGDTLLLGLDHDNAKDLIEEAYNDKAGISKNFIMNGLKAAGAVFGDENMFAEDKWEFVNRYNEAERRHEGFYRAKTDHSVHDPASGNKFSFVANEMVKIEESFKFSEADVYTLFTDSNLRPIQRWTDSASQYSLWLLERPSFNFPLLSSPHSIASSGEIIPKTSYSSSPYGVPSPQDWRNMWAAWDCITRGMIPPSMLFEKPIDLRHICLFYLGHIPTFLDIHLSRLLEEPHTEPEEYKYIFERGIDPNVDDPSQCHPHSEVPQNDEEWPSVSSIMQFQARVRARLLKLYSDVDEGKIPMTRKIARVLFMTFEHEAFHAETLLYMLLQRAGTGTLPPFGFAPPDWASLSAIWDSTPTPKSPTVTLGPATITLGHDDDEAEDMLPDKANDVGGHEFGWDNEHPKREVSVGEFRIEWRPVTNGQFYKFYKGRNGQDLQMPASWVEQDGEIHVRTLYGPVPIKIARHWPIATSYDNLSKYAIVNGGRLPTESELRLFYEKFESGYEGGANTGFRNWHPVPATSGGERSGGKGSNGGVWEWTSTVFDEYDGFKPSTLYPGYSMDFFDGAHQVVIGGSYATIPRISERKSVRNWYQRNYPYPWVGGRVVYDI